MKILYLDESGTHSIANPEFDYPVFVLGGVIMEKDYAEREVKARLEAFKMAVFGRRDLILHTADITRNRNGFERLTELAFRKYFYEELNKLLEDLAYKVVACAIDKRDYSALFQQYGFDPYHLSLRILIEMFCHEIGDGSAHGAIIVESRDKKLDRGVKSIWDGLLVTGTKKCSGKTIDKRLAGLKFHTKSDGISGLELADLMVSPIGRRILGKQDKEDWRIIERKLVRDDAGNYKGVGLKILP